MIEPVFGHTKHNRGMGRFHRRGRGAVRAEWRLITATHNLLKLCDTPPHRGRLSGPRRRAAPTIARNRPRIRIAAAGTPDATFTRQPHAQAAVRT